MPASPDRAILSDPQPSSASTLEMSGPPLNGGDADHSPDSFTHAAGSLLPPLGLQSPCFPVDTPIWHFTFGDSTLGALSLRGAPFTAHLGHTLSLESLGDRQAAPVSP